MYRQVLLPHYGYYGLDISGMPDYDLGHAKSFFCTCWHMYSCLYTTKTKTFKVIRVVDVMSNNCFYIRTWYVLAIMLKKIANLMCSYTNNTLKGMWGLCNSFISLTT